MISVDQAISVALKEVVPLTWEYYDIVSSVGRIAAEDIKAVYPFPTFRASIMDGYAVEAPLTIGDAFEIQSSVLAGDMRKDNELILQKGKVTYVTTGAKVPLGVSWHNIPLFRSSNPFI